MGGPRLLLGALGNFFSAGTGIRAACLPVHHLLYVTYSVKILWPTNVIAIAKRAETLPHKTELTSKVGEILELEFNTQRLCKILLDLPMFS